MATLTDVIARPTGYSGIWSWITTVDHKRIGVLYGTTAFIFMLFAGIEAGVIRVQLSQPELGIVSPGRYNEMFTMHATVMIFMVVMPLSASFFNFVVPLAIGARDVAFPRLNALSYWIFLFGGILMHVSFAVGEVPDAGWFSYANLTEKPFSPDRGLDFWSLSLLVLGASSVAAALNFVVTIVNLRAPGMTLMRMPVFVWMTLITSILLVLAFPVITVGLIELTMDRNFGTHFFVPTGGGDPILWQHLFWVFGHPEVYILILPPMGIVSEILPTFSRKPLFGYPFIVFSGIVIGMMGWAVWSHHMFTTLITSILLVLAFPVITVGLIELTMDRNFGTHFFVPTGGGDPILWQHLFWVFGHPEVYILILPPMGIVSEILPTFSKKPLFGYPFIVFSGIVIGMMGWAVWSHHMFTVGLGPVANSVFTITTMLIAVPTGVKIFNWMGTLWKGSIEFSTAMLFALGFITLFIIGGLSGVSHAVSPSDFQQQDTYYVVAHLHYVLFGGSVFGIFAGIYYWYPKITGKMLSEFWGKITFALMFIGMNVTFFPMHYAGMNGMPRRIFTYAEEFGWGNLNLLSTFGYFVLFISILTFMYSLWQSRRSRPVSHDPWDAPGLEWSIASPPPPYNFAEIPRVEGRDHYWILKDRAREEGNPITGPEAPVDPASIHMPSPSYWPIITAAGVALIGGGIVSHYGISFLGGVIAFLGVIGWANEPAAAPEEGRAGAHH